MIVCSRLVVAFLEYLTLNSEYCLAEIVILFKLGI